MDVGGAVSGFVSQAQRVLNVTHKPKGDEYSHIAKSTAAGMAFIGLVGFIMSLLGMTLR